MRTVFTAEGRPCVGSWVSVLGVAVFRRGVARFLAVVLCLVAPGLMVWPSAAAEPVVEGVVAFADVPESSLFHNEISWLAAEGISTGWDVGSGVREYRPLDSIARDAMAAFLYRLAGSPAYTPPATSPFTDVAPGVAFYKEITWLASQGISTGWDVGGGKREYRPLNPIARDAMGAFLFRFAKPGEFAAPAQSPFVDVPAGAAFYREITWLASAGISTGWDIGGVREYRPLNSVARDAMAAFLYRLHQKMAPQPAPSCTPPLTHLSGTLNADRTLDATCSTTYQIDGDFTIAAGATLFIAAGTTVHASTDARLIVEGSLTIDGDENQPILFTAAPGSAATAGAVGEDLASESQRAQVSVTAASGSWKGIEVRPGGTVKSRNLTVRSAATGLSAQALTTNSAPTTVSLDATTFADSGTCVSLQGPVTGHFHGSVRDCVVGVSADYAFNATAVDWGSNQGPGAIDSGRPTLQGSNVSVFPWTGSILPPVPSAISSVPTLGECGDYLFIGVRGSGEEFTEANFGMGNAIQTTFDEFSKEIQAHKPGAVVRQMGLEYPAYAVPIIKQRDKVFEYVPGAWQGAVEILASVEREQSKCASFGERIVLAGYSQGAWAIHTALNYAATSDRVDMSRIAAVGLLGDAQRLSGATEKQLGDAPSSTFGVANTQFLGSPLYGFSDWLASSTDETVRQWKLEADVPMHKIVAIQSIPDAVLSVTGSLCGRYDPVCGLGDIRIDAGVHDYSSERRQELGRWLAGKAAEAAPPVPLTGVRTVAADTFSWDNASAFAIGIDGSVRAWGSNQSGQLGIGNTMDSPLPRTVRGISNVESITAQCGATYAVKKDGTLWAWGSNFYGQLGDGTHTNNPVPRQVSGIVGVKSVVSICDAVYVLKTDGSVMAWGRNHDGQLGVGTTLDSAVPLAVRDLMDVKELVGGHESVFALKHDGSVWAWGLVGRSMPWRSPVSTRPIELEVANVKSLAVDETGSTAIALTNDGRVWAWGENSGGQLGIGHNNPVRSVVENPFLRGVTSIAAGWGTEYAVKSDGSVWSWGYNNYGELGSGVTSHFENTPVQVASALANIKRVDVQNRTAFAIDGAGRVFGWGENNAGQVGAGTYSEATPTPTSPQGVHTFATLTVGYASAYGVRSDGSVWAWGINSDGQLGIGTTSNSNIPVRVGPRLD